MGRKRTVRVGTFTAKEGDGTEHVVVIYAQQFSTATLDGAGGGWMEGSRSMRTTAGAHVNFKGKGAYELLASDGRLVPLTSDDANAP
jgi:hypothetical protein